jgi:hypothetical protein
MRTRARANAGIAALLVALVGATAWGQRVQPGRGLTLIVDSIASRGRSEVPTEHVDDRRTNASPEPLPGAGLRIVWSRQMPAMAHPPVVARDGTIIVLGQQGEATLINHDGTDRGRVAMGPGPTSAPALLADGTLVALNAAGDLVGVRGTSVVFRAHVAPAGEGAVVEPPRMSRPFSRPRRSFGAEPAATARSSTLPLADGGLVVARGHELVSVDCEGTIRSRASSPALLAVPLVATDDGVAFATDDGEVFEWNLRGSIDPVSARGSFGGPVDGVVVGEDARHLLAVVRGNRLVSLDLRSGVVETRASSAGGFTDALALGGGVAFLQELTASGTRRRFRSCSPPRARSELPTPAEQAASSRRARPSSWPTRAAPSRMRPSTATWGSPRRRRRSSSGPSRVEPPLRPRVRSALAVGRRRGSQASSPPVLERS